MQVIVHDLGEDCAGKRKSVLAQLDVAERETVLIALPAALLSPRFGGHVARRAGAARRYHAAAGSFACQPEVRDLGETLQQQNVFGLDVAVPDLAAMEEV